MKNKFKYTAGIIVALASGYLLWWGFYIYVEPTVTGPAVATKSEALVYILSNKLDVIRFILNGYSQGLIEQHSIVKRLVGYDAPGITLLIGFLMLAFNLSAFYLYFTRRKIIASSLPVLLIIFSAVIVFGILLSRFPLEGPLYSLNDRYQRMSVIGVFGSYWIYALVFFGSRSRKEGRTDNTGKPGRLLTGALTIAILLNSLVSHTVNWKLIYLNEKISLNTIAAGIIEYSENPKIDLGKYVTYRHCRDDICKPTVQFLQENKFSVFRPSHIIHRGQEIISGYDANPPGK